MLRVFADSSTKEACIVVGDEPPMVIPYGETVTNNEGEYRAVWFALEEVIKRKRTEATVLTDSLLVVNQVNGLWKCQKESLLPLRDTVKKLLLESGAELIWIAREDNLAGKVLG